MWEKVKLIIICIGNFNLTMVFLFVFFPMFKLDGTSILDDLSSRCVSTKEAFPFMGWRKPLSANMVFCVDVP